jgi:hypothetical protein
MRITIALHGHTYLLSSEGAPIEGAFLDELEEHLTDSWLERELRRSLSDEAGFDAAAAPEELSRIFRALATAGRIRISEQITYEEHLDELEEIEETHRARDPRPHAPHEPPLPGREPAPPGREPPLPGREPRQAPKAKQRNRRKNQRGRRPPVNVPKNVAPPPFNFVMAVPNPPPDTVPEMLRREDPVKELLTIEWVTRECWCGDTVTVRGTTLNYANNEEVAVQVVDQTSGKNAATFNVKITGNTFTHRWLVKDVLPPTLDTKLMQLDARAQGKTTPRPLEMKFAPDAAKRKYTRDYARFELEANDYAMKIIGDIEYVPGWAAEVVKLGNTVGAGVGGVIAGFTWAGYRWMKQVGKSKRYWDGAAWKRLPARFRLRDANNFAVGFTQVGANFVCQYGGNWPEQFRPWNVDEPKYQSKLAKWVAAIDKKWSRKFDIKPAVCQSAAKPCCRYSTTCTTSFTKKAVYAGGMLVLAKGNIRSNDSLWFLGNDDLTMPPHEFGHHLGNPDEYKDADVDTTLNSDGARNGIDPNSIMGVNKSTVKKRHYRTLCTHFTNMISSQYGKSYNYVAVAKQ